MSAQDYIATLGLDPAHVAAIVAADEKIPAEKRETYHAACTIIYAANDTMIPPAAYITTDTGKASWRQGYAHKFLFALRSFAESYFDGNVETALEAVQKTSDWRMRQGIGSLHRPACDIYRVALARSGE